MVRSRGDCTDVRGELPSEVPPQSRQSCGSPSCFQQHRKAARARHGFPRPVPQPPPSVFFFLLLSRRRVTARHRSPPARPRRGGTARRLVVGWCEANALRQERDALLAAERAEQEAAEAEAASSRGSTPSDTEPNIDELAASMEHLTGRRRCSMVDLPPLVANEGFTGRRQSMMAPPSPLNVSGLDLHPDLLAMAAMHATSRRNTRGGGGGSVHGDADKDKADANPLLDDRRHREARAASASALEALLRVRREQLLIERRADELQEISSRLNVQHGYQRWCVIVVFRRVSSCFCAHKRGVDRPAPHAPRPLLCAICFAHTS